MIQTIVTPDKADLNINVLVPENYVGKQVHVFLYRDDEVKNAHVSVTSKKKPSDYFGTLSIDEGEKMQEYIIQSRN